MLKTTIDRPGKPLLALLVLGILHGYVKHPLLFLLTTILTLPRFKRHIPKEFPDEFVRTAALQTWLYIRLKERMGREKAYDIVRALVIPVGLSVQQGNFRTVEAPRTFENLIHFQQQTNREGPTRWNELEIIEQNDERYVFRVKNCLFHEFFTQMGVPELTAVICSVDNAIFNTYLPEEITFHRDGVGNRIADGAPECRFVCEHHKKT